MVGMDALWMKKSISDERFVSNILSETILADDVQRNVFSRGFELP
jgi:hypothetical protein